MADVTTIATMGWMGDADDRAVAIGTLGWFIGITLGTSAPFAINVSVKRPVVNFSVQKPEVNITVKKPEVRFVVK